ALPPPARPPIPPPRSSDLAATGRDAAPVPLRVRTASRPPGGAATGVCAPDRSGRFGGMRVLEIDHPLVAHKLTVLRDAAESTGADRESTRLNSSHVKSSYA